MKIVTLNVTSRPNSKLLKAYPDLKIDTKVNVNYESHDLKNEIQWQIAASRNKHDHSTNTGKMLLKETENLMIFTSN